MIAAALSLLLLAPARAATVVGTDKGGADYTPAAGDILSGTFTNVGKFTIPSGQTNFVAPGVNLIIYASTVAIYGTLDGSGAGQDGGNGGAAGTAGSAGRDGGAKSEGGEGAAGGAGFGGGGASASGAGGAGGGGALAGAVYGSTGAYVSFPLSSDDVAQGSGGGGGGGGTNLSGGQGSAGGGAIYIEASSMTINGSILAPGATANSVSEFSVAASHPAGGGGGSGGTILLRVTGPLDLRGALLLSANGGKGGDVNSSVGGTLYPGGGGGGGWIKLFSNSANYGASVALSTAAGAAGFRLTAASGSDGSPAPTPVSSGTVSFGTIASPPSAPSVTATSANSITWSWTATPSFGDGPTASQQQYRLFASTGAPMPSPTVTSAVVGVTENSLQPDTTYQRVITAFSDWGDSLPTGFISTHTLATAPVAAAFANVYSSSITVNWTAANQSYTKYEVDQALDAGFTTGVTITNPLVATSSTPINLTPNTNYFFRARAINCDNVPTAFTAVMSTATLGAVPANPQFGQVFVTSASYVWSANGNPAGTTYLVQVSSDNFFTLVDSSQTLNTSATFFTLTPNTQYFYRSFSINRVGAISSASALIHGASGNLTDLTAPSSPGTPFADRQYSYDGTMTFMWSAANSSVGILDYNLLIGSTAGGNDVFNGNVTVASASISGLATGKSYFAEVRARANNGVIGPFSNVSQGVPVFIPGGTAPIMKPYNWPNPFNPATGSTQIGVFMDTAGTAVLKIYTLNGQLVHQQSTDLGQGNQVLTWNGKSDSGGTVSPGGYIGVIEKRASGGTSTQKFKMAVLY